MARRSARVPPSDVVMLFVSKFRYSPSAVRLELPTETQVPAWPRSRYTFG